MGNKIISSNKLNESFIEKYQNNSNWMEENFCYFNNIDSSDTPIDKRPLISIKNKELRNIPLLRSHQTASYNINSIYDAISICQHVSTYYQLVCGARVLDLRPAMFQNINKIKSIFNAHGPHKADLMTNVFDEIKLFLQKNTKEIIILEFQKSRGVGEFSYLLKESNCKDLLQLISSYFNEIIINSKDLEDLNKTCLANLTYEEIAYKLNKNIIIIIKDKDIILSKYENLELAEKEGFFLTSKNYIGDWPNTNNPEKTILNSEMYISKAEYTKFLNFVFQLTPAGLFDDDPLKLHIKLFNYGNEKLFQWEKLENLKFIAVDWMFDQIHKGTMNIIGLDFLNIYPSIFQGLILKKMNVFKLVVGDKRLITKLFNNQIQVINRLVFKNNCQDNLNDNQKSLILTELEKPTKENSIENYFLFEQVTDLNLDKIDNKEGFINNVYPSGNYYLKSCFSNEYVYCSIPLNKFSFFIKEIKNKNSVIIPFNIVFNDKSDFSNKYDIINNFLIFPLIVDVSFPQLKLENGFFSHDGKMTLFYDYFYNQKEKFTDYIKNIINTYISSKSYEVVNDLDIISNDYSSKLQNIFLAY